MNNKKIILLLVSLLIAGCAEHTAVTRHMMNPWEKDIGYAQVVQAGNAYYISGVTCQGPAYEKAVQDCYSELQSILGKFQLTSKNIVKENVYALDIEKFKEQIAQRKKFYGESEYPSATWVQVSRLYSPEHVIEIELVAVK